MANRSLNGAKCSKMSVHSVCTTWAFGSMLFLLLHSTPHGVAYFRLRGETWTGGSRYLSPTLRNVPHIHSEARRRYQIAGTLLLISLGGVNEQQTGGG